MDAVSTTRTATAVAVDPGPQQVIWVGTSDGLVARLEGETASFWEVYETGSVQYLSLSRDGSLLLAADSIDGVRILRTADGSHLDAFRCMAAVQQGAILAPREYVTVDGLRNGQLWTATDDTTLRATAICSINDTPCPFDEFGVAEDGSRLALRSALNWMVWERQGNRVQAIHQPIDGMQLMYMAGVAGLSRNGRYYFVYWDDYAVFDTNTGEMLWEHPIRNRAASAILSNDAQHLVVGGEAGDLTVLDSDGELVVNIRPAPEEVVQVDIRPDGVLAAWLDRAGGFGLVNVTTGEEVLERSRAMELLRSEAEYN
jgi:outer membrane protein assembly factor BamB